MFKKIIPAILILPLLACSGCGTAANNNSPSPLDSTPEQGSRPFSADELIKNAELWNGERLLNDEFQLLIEYFDDRVVKDGLGVNYSAFGGDFLHTPYCAGEWGNGLLTESGSVSPYGVKAVSTFYPNPPKTREEAYERIQEHLKLTYIAASPDSNDKLLTSMNCFYPWHHYAGEAGFKNLGTEIGVTAPGYQFRLAMNRGAAKQYGTTWFVDFSSWSAGDDGEFILDYNVENPEWESYSSPTGGHSINLVERSFLLSYMAGADAVIAEGGQHIAYYTRDEDAELTPYGEVCKKINEFAKKYSDMGTAYTPYAIILDKYHGMGIGNGRGVAVNPDQPIFGNLFYADEEDEFTYSIFDTILWKGALSADVYDNEEDVMANTKYGDTFDCLLQNASPELLDTYSVLIFSGNIELSDEELDNYVNYVKNGGNLVINTAYVHLFDSLDVELPDDMNNQNYVEVPYGDGIFYVYGKGGLPEISYDADGKMQFTYCGDWKTGGLGLILDKLHGEYMPFAFSEEIGYSVSVKDGYMYLYVFNNEGVSKENNKPTVIDETKAVELTVEYTGDHSVLSAEDIYNGYNVELSGNTFSIDLEAGGMAVIELKLG